MILQFRDIIFEFRHSEWIGARDRKRRRNCKQGPRAATLCVMIQDTFRLGLCQGDYLAYSVVKMSGLVAVLFHSTET
jgi:hypothetical protein